MADGFYIPYVSRNSQTVVSTFTATGELDNDTSETAASGMETTGVAVVTVSSISTAGLDGKADSGIGLSAVAVERILSNVGRARAGTDAEEVVIRVDRTMEATPPAACI